MELPPGWEQAHVAAMDGWLAVCGTLGEAEARQRLEGCLAGLAPAAAVRAFERLLHATLAWQVWGGRAEQCSCMLRPPHPSISAPSLMSVSHVVAPACRWREEREDGGWEAMLSVLPALASDAVQDGALPCGSCVTARLELCSALDRTLDAKWAGEGANATFNGRLGDWAWGAWHCSFDACAAPHAPAACTRCPRMPAVHPLPQRWRRGWWPALHFQ